MARPSPIEAQSPNGRQRLIDAALRLGAQKSSLDSIGLRELAREAGLNPNTFYRHFASLDELGFAVVEHFGNALRADRNAAHMNAPDFPSFMRDSLQRYFEYTAQHPSAFVLGFRELSAPGEMSRAVRKLMHELAQELVVITRHFGLLSRRSDAELLEIAGFIIDQLFMLALPYIERPRERAAIVERALRFTELLHRGAEEPAVTTRAAPSSRSSRSRRSRDTRSAPARTK
jgi:AcrR family transcriptional regulator